MVLCAVAICPHQHTDQPIMERKYGTAIWNAHEALQVGAIACIFTFGFARQMGKAGSMEAQNESVEWRHVLMH